MSERKRHIDTKLVHAGDPIPRIEGAVTMPIFQSSTFESAGGDSYDTMRYIRLNNTPNHDALHKKLAELENAEAALVTASGMAAISTAFFTLLKPGGHLLAQDVLYGGTLGLLNTQFEALGLSYDFIDGRDPSTSSPVYDKPQRITRDTEVKAVAALGDKLSPVVTASFRRRKDDRSVEIAHPYSPQYTAGGDVGLIDGIRGVARKERTG